LSYNNSLFLPLWTDCRFSTPTFSGELQKMWHNYYASNLLPPYLAKCECSEG